MMYEPNLTYILFKNIVQNIDLTHKVIKYKVSIIFEHSVYSVRFMNTLF